MDIEDLYELIRKDNVCLFIGAGFSLYAGYPSGGTLAKIIFNSLTEEEKNKVYENSGLSKLAQDFITLKNGSRNELIAILRKEFIKKPTNTHNHDLLSRVSFFRTIITTNYDTLIEDSYTSRAVVISKPIDVTIPQHNKVKIYKIHGDIHDDKSIVITDKDYSNLYGTDYRNPFWASIISELASKHIVFLGYGYEDLNVWSLFEKILEHTNGEGKKMFYVSPFIPELKEAFLKQNDIHSYKITAEEFLNGLHENIKDNLKKDIEDKSISISTGQEVFDAHNLKIGLNLSPEKNWITSIENATGVTQQEIQFQISDRRVIEKYKRFTNGKGGLNLTFTGKDLASFKYSIEGFSFLKLDTLAKLTVQTPAVFSQTCSIQFLHSDFEVENIRYDVYNLKSNRLLVKTTIDTFRIEINIDISKQPKFTFKVKIFEPNKLISINSAIKVYMLAHFIFSGKSFNLHFQNNKSLLNKSLDVKNNFTPSYLEKLRFFEALKQIEKHFNVKFKDVKIADLQKSALPVNHLLKLINQKRVIVDNKDGVIIDAQNNNIEVVRALKKTLKNKVGVVVFHKGKEIIHLLGLDFDLGDTQILIFEPYSSEETDTSILVKSKSNTITMMYEKFGFQDDGNLIAIW
ncbi:SIR2 family protein [Pedobacter jamesrossensis]|uniref:SIR2 family protein n=1 Tax=Pedobacter jamesrossensis TaxID=1908238 RepID=A0ABV8NJ48_9SPHI